MLAGLAEANFSCRPSASNPTPLTSYLIESNRDAWEKFTQMHPFLLRIRDGTLPREVFIEYLRQVCSLLVPFALGLI